MIVVLSEEHGRFRAALFGVVCELEVLRADIADLSAVAEMAERPTAELQRLARCVGMALQMRGAA